MGEIRAVRYDDGNPTRSAVPPRLTPMPPLSPARRLIDLALAEDLGVPAGGSPAGDVTSQATIPAETSGRAAFVARAAGVVAGLPVAALVLGAVDPRLTFTPALADGAAVTPG